MEYLNKAYLLIGGNVGNKLANLQLAVSILQNQLGNVAACSAVYETAPWGNTNQSSFLNQALELETNYEAQDLMTHLLRIESDMGRIRHEKNGPRIIDLDILFFNEDVIQTTTLIIPHKELQNRRFVLQPLADIASSFIHPVLKKSVAQLLDECPDDSEVKINKA